MGQSMETTVDGRLFRVEFSYTRKKALARGININGVTACAIVDISHSVSGQVMLGTAVCSPSDQFSRRTGRATAFFSATERLPEDLQLGLEGWFMQRFPSPAFQPPKPKNVLSPEEIAKLRHTVAADLIREDRKRMRQIRERSGAGEEGTAHG